MGLIYKTGFLRGPSGFAFAKKCCCRVLNCYCYTNYNYYGSQIKERKIVCYKAPYYDNDLGRWVFPDGQPCDPPANSQCSVTKVGVVVTLCSCPKQGSQTGESYRWALIPANATSSTSCTTITPPP